jgi:hypothetical protein
VPRRLRKAMAEEITVKEAGASPESAHISVSDLLRYEEIIVKIVHVWKSVTTLAVGAVSKLTVMTVHVGSGTYTWDMGSLKREK